MSSPSFVARLAAAAIVSVAASSAASAQGTFTYLPGPAYDVSADGAKVVGVDANGAYIYDINSNTFNAIGPATTALGISADGNHVIGDIDDPNNNESAGWWDPTFGWTALGTFPGFGGCGSSISSAYEISHDGTTVSGSAGRVARRARSSGPRAPASSSCRGWSRPTGRARTRSAVTVVTSAVGRPSARRIRGVRRCGGRAARRR